MLHNDLSNQAGKRIAFRFEDTIVSEKKSLLKRALNTFIEVDMYEFNQTVCNQMQTIYRDTDYNVDIVIPESLYTDKVKDKLQEICFSSIILIKKEVQVSQRLLMGDICLYVDDNAERRSEVNSEYAVSSKSLFNVLKRRKMI